jgi:microcystin-dependent protein
MSNPFIGEIRIFAGTFAPTGWAFCQGQAMAIAENDALFALIGTTYGGDGQTTFNLPDLRSRLPVHRGSGGIGNPALGQAGGVESVTLTTTQIPAHTHGLNGSTATATTSAPGGAVPATLSGVTTFAYGADAPPTTLAPQSLAPSGGNQPHDNLQPYLAVNFIISLFGIFPSQG